jgi:hypothetical protein
MQKPDLNKLPDHTDDLNNILALAKKSYKKYLEDLKDGYVTKRKEKTYKYIFESYLYAVADLSLEMNTIQDDLQQYYVKTYKDTPALGNKLFYQEYFGLHKEYDKVKRFIWKAIFKVDYINDEDEEKNVVQPDILI